MANRIAKFASAIFASLLAGAPITIITSSFAHAAGDCQTKPGSETRQGQHWYYRIESKVPSAIAGICAQKAKGLSRQHHPKVPPPLREETKPQ
jgi:hypothetical protein